VIALLVTLAVVCAVAALHGQWARRALRERSVRVAHEVRGPLSAAHLALHGAARRGEVPARLVAALELELRRAALALGDPCGAGATTEVDLEELLRCQAVTWQEIAAVRGARVRLVSGLGGGSVVRADALRVAQATSNVVANAIEHGGGDVEIRTRTVGDRVRVEVTDGGPGLAAPVAELSRTRRRGRPGRGRGLAITSELVARYGGRLQALPSPRGGRVAIDLPAAEGRS
jgi:two-component system sensor histidine kinase MtrB